MDIRNLSSPSGLVHEQQRSSCVHIILRSVNIFKFLASADADFCPMHKLQTGIATKSGKNDALKIFTCKLT